MRINLIEIPKIEDYRGNIAVLENEVVPFKIKNIHYFFEVPSDFCSMGKAYKNKQQLLIPLSGSFDVKLDNGKTLKTISLNKPDKGLLIKSFIWFELCNFSPDAVCLVIASEKESKKDLIDDYDVFLEYTNSHF